MASGRAIDHVVVAVRDLSAAAAQVEALGFTVTPRASHPDHMGTVNRLVQFANHSFIELVQVDRPHLLAAHDFSSTPPRFSFGAHVKTFAEKRDGMAALVLPSDDAHGDVARFAAAGIDTYAPLDFERHTTLPDGTQKTVAFSLAFATSPDMPEIAFYTCQNRFPENFWKPEFQAHANGASGLTAVTLVDEMPTRHADFLSRLTGTTIEPVTGGFRVPCGAEQSLLVISPDELNQEHAAVRAATPCFAGVTIEGPVPPGGEVNANSVCGLLFEWRPRRAT